MMWVLIATGFTGALTLIYWARAALRRLGKVPTVGVYFSPHGGCTDAVVSEIQRARREVLVQAYSFTAEAISRALVDAKKRGAQVDILLDRSNEQEAYSDLHVFLENGLTPLIDAKHAIAHNKVIILDGRTVITGSFNFTRQAEQENAENLLVIKGHAELVSHYRQNFLNHKSHSQPPNPLVEPLLHRPAA